MPKLKRINEGLHKVTVGTRVYQLKHRGALGWQLCWSSWSDSDVFVDFTKTIREANETLAFVLAAAELLRDLGAVEKFTQGGYWHLKTELGPLEIRPRGSGVFMRFPGDLVAARRHLGRDGSLNPYSGKWNLHWWSEDKVGLQDKVRALELHLGRLPRAA